MPWKFRLTVCKADELAHQRQAKMPKLELASLHTLLIDDPPSLEINNGNMGINSVRNLLAVHDVAVAMRGGAHLANLKAYSHKFGIFDATNRSRDYVEMCIHYRKSGSRPSNLEHLE